MYPKVGDLAPEFTLNDSEGRGVSLSDFRGHRVVVYFYPKDSTPGCTKEACDFRDSFQRINEKDVVLIGISADSAASHKKFAEKYDLPFHLLSDPEHKVLEQYGVWKEKNMMGRRYMGIERTTYVIDEEGRIAHVYPKVKVDGHVGEVLGFLGI